MSFSSSSSTPKFDVFLSFSREAKILVSDLRLSFSENGITMKDDELENGVSCIGSERSEGIAESKVAVVVITRSYAISAQCLNELQTIVNFHDERRISILPIFYGVDYEGVRNQIKELAESFRKLGKEYPSEKVQAWRIALMKLINISCSDSRIHDDEFTIDMVITCQVKRILSVKDKPINLRATSSHTVSDKQINSSATKVVGLVGLDRHMLSLYELLDLKSNEEVRLMGICGQGGVGKTTLAKYAYEELFNNFHAHVFVDNAEKIYQQDTDESHSQESLTSREIQEGTQTMTKSLTVTSDFIKSTVLHQRSLLVVDCVDNIKQLKEIADIVGLCCPGSRVIFVTQDKKLVDGFGVEHVYEVQSLRYDEALQLFSQSAFNQEHPPASFESLSFRAVRVAGFLPLLLKILGSSLQNKDAKYWEKELQKLEGDQEKAIMEVMKKAAQKKKSLHLSFL